MNPEILNLVDIELSKAGFTVVRSSSAGSSLYYGKSRDSKLIRVSSHSHRNNNEDDLHDTILIADWSDPETLVQWTRDAIATFPTT